ncbi:MAG: hypothetical protein QNJ97_18710 [Myxococcota bacterium]|nr:hypothetical protein [Myxococcota bacterium]
MDNSQLRLGEILVEAGVVKPDQLEKALEIQQKRQLRLGTILLQEGFVGEPQLVQALSRRLSIPWVSLWHIDIDDELLELVPVSVAEEFFLLPIYVRTTGKGERALYVAMNDPTDDSALRFVAASAGMTVRPMIAGPSDISAAIRLYYYNEEEASEDPPPPIPPPPNQGMPARITPMPPPITGLQTKNAPPPTPEHMRGPSVPPPPPISEESAAPDKSKPAIMPDAPKDILSHDISPEVAVSKSDQSASMPDKAPQVTETVEKAIASDAPQEDIVRTQREIEKHMFGVGGGKKPRAISLTLLDGTTIDFGGASTTPTPSNELTAKTLVSGLRAAAKGAPIDGLLPSTRWEDYMAALLEVLFRKHLVLFDEFMAALKKTK